MAYTAYLDTVQKAYIAYYQRPAESAGLRYWAEALDKVEGDQTKMIEAFADSKESTALYGPINNDTIGNVVDAMYQALFGRKAEAAGKKVYVDGFKNGKYTAGSIALDILTGAISSDEKAIASKLKVANQFTLLTDGRKKASDAKFGTGEKFHVTYEGDADAATARSMLSKVVSKATELSTAEIWLVAKLISDKGDPIEKDKNPTIPPPPPPPSAPSATTHKLTAGFPYDNLTADTDNDIFNALLDSSNTVTLDSGDEIYGKSNGSNILNIELGIAGGGLQGAIVKNIKTINVLGGANTTSNVNFGATELEDVTKLTNLNVGSSASVLGATHSVTVNGGTSSTLKNVNVYGGSDIDIQGDSLTTVDVQGAAGDVEVKNTTTTALNANITLATGSTKKIKVTANAGNVTTNGGKEVEIVSGKDVTIKGSLLDDVKVTSASGKISVDHDVGTGNDVNVKTSSTTENIDIIGGKTVTTAGGKHVTIDGSDLAAISIKNSNGTINIGTTTASDTDLNKITIDGATIVTTTTTHTIKGEAVNELTLKDITATNAQTFDIANSIETAITVKAEDANAVVNLGTSANSVTVDSAGSGNSIKLSGGTGVTTLSISGSTKLTLDGVSLTNTGLTSINGSSATGGLHVKGFGSNITSMTGTFGGDDTFEVAVGSKVVLIGNGGDDTFDVSNNTAGAGTTFTGIYSVTINDFSGDTIIYDTSGSASTGSVSTDFTWDTDLDTTLVSAASSSTAGEIQYFFDAANSDTYIVVNDGSTGLSTNDIVVKLLGISSLASVDYDSGKITITL